MKKSLILCSMLAVVCAANAAEYLFDTQADCTLQTPYRKIEFRNGMHVLNGNCHFWTTKMFKHDPSKKYTISAEVMTDCKQKVPGSTFGFVYFDDKGRMISTREYVTAPNSFTELAKAMNPSDTTIVIKTPPAFKKHEYWSYVLAFDAKADETDLPNPKVTTKIKKMDITPETITLTIEKPTYAAMPAGTKVRLHYALSFYHPIDLNNFYVHPTAQWKKVVGTIKIPHGVKNFRPAIIYYSKGLDTYFYVRNFKLIEE